MKTSLTIITTVLFLSAMAQGSIDGTTRTGWAAKAENPVVAFGFNFNAHGAAIAPEIIIPFEQSTPVLMGLKFSYKYKFIEAGYGRYFDFATTDNYDKYRNGYSNSAFVAIHWKFNVDRMIENWFLEYDYNDKNGSQITFGIRETLFNIQ